MQLQLYGNKIWIFRQPIDFRLSIDGCPYICGEFLPRLVGDQGFANTL